MKAYIEDLTLFLVLTFILFSPFLILLTVIVLSYFWSLPWTLLTIFIYCSWIYIDRNTDIQGGRWSNYLRRLSIWSMASAYFPVQLIKTEDLDPTRNYIFGVHPHGLLTVGVGVNFLTEATRFSDLFPGIRPRLMTIRFNFFVPLIRDLYSWLGACRVSRESCQYLLNDRTRTGGSALIIVVGGMREIYLTEYHNMVFYLKSRKGFIRLALENGLVDGAIIMIMNIDRFLLLSGHHWYQL